MFSSYISLEKAGTNKLIEEKMLIHSIGTKDDVLPPESIKIPPGLTDGSSPLSVIFGITLVIGSITKLVAVLVPNENKKQNKKE
ncbi:MAG: hypothetical protein QNJ54_10525 [Prochloraceae cyanobacterium]|nr:hypothetical protein [Prochloraceae cyanobacterium]